MEDPLYGGSFPLQCSDQQWLNAVDLAVHPTTPVSQMPAQLSASAINQLRHYASSPDYTPTQNSQQ